MDEPIYRQPTPFRPVAQPGGGQIAVLSQPVGNGASLAAALMRGSGGGARSIGHGIGQAASKIAAAGIAKREKEETAKRNEALARLLTDPNATPEQVAAGFAAAGDYSIAKDAYNRRVNPPERKILQGADGYNYYIDTGERVIPSAVKEPDLTADQKEFLAEKRAKALELVDDGKGGKRPVTFTEWKRANKKSGASNIQVGGGGPLTPGQKKADENFATEVYNKFVTGGSADIQKNMQQLEGVLNRLESGDDNLSGPFVGKMPDFVASIFNPESVQVREQVEEVVQRNLREVLGAQFTQKEGDRLISRAFNPQLEEGENAKRLRRLLSSIKKAYDAKVAASQYYEKNGTLRGFEGSTQVTMQQIENDMLGGGEDTQQQQNPTASSIPPAAVEFLKANPETRDQFDQMFGDGAAEKALKGN